MTTVSTDSLGGNGGTSPKFTPTGKYIDERHFFPNQSQMKREIDEFFEKKFKYQPSKDSQWNLPPAKELFTEYYQWDSMQELRERLNSVKSKLNDYNNDEWSRHTRSKDPAGEIPWRLKSVTRAEFVTVAWCKFFECLHQYPLVKGPKLNSLHLCEAPGAFITALNHYLHSTYNPDEVQWKWLSTSYNPYYEGNFINQMITDDRFIINTLDNWVFYDDFTGNIMNRTNIETMKRVCDQRLDGEVHLITADGSIDCTDKPDCQEETVSRLHFAEICTALSILAEGGSFVLKMFTLYDASSISKMYLLNCVFEELHVFKPATSKRGNSENYIICLGFKKTENFPSILDAMLSKLAEDNVLPMFQKSHIPKDFLMQTEICARRFMNLQINSIENNIYTYELKSHMEKRRIHTLRTLVCDEYYRRFKVKELPQDLNLVNCKGPMKSVARVLLRNTIFQGSHAERKHLEETSVEEQIFALKGRMNDIEKSLVGPTDVLLQENASVELDSIELKVYTGAPYKTLHSSLFIHIHVLLLRQKLLELFHVDPVLMDEPKCIFENSQLFVNFCELNFYEIERNFMHEVLKSVLSHKHQKITFKNYAFLTHLSVSILRYLSINCFKKFTISTDPEFEIRLEAGDYNEKTVESLKKLINLLQKENSNVVCILDIVLLHNNEFFDALTEFNNRLLLRNSKVLLNN